ncbi:CHAP domain-containing protein [Allosaccharopolyspora coralli]|uniref:CHAP domain-containing protein n=2 Tax=Allosaccharopolyspora coralli TaxID=2665642 RepID=A0A5Q3QCJ2_9PSEU|nr:CHAP domain-containing protein [Allosaccharopolyspora coralli]
MSFGSAAAAPVSHPDGPVLSGPAAQIVQQIKDSQNGPQQKPQAAKDNAGAKKGQAKGNGQNKPRQAPAPAPSLPDRIISAAQPEIGTTETGGDNCQKYSGQCVSWCALFAMNMWQDAGVDVDPEQYAFTGNVYETGQEKGTAYDAENLDQAKPGDVLLFGTGPSSPSTSKHIGIVEKVDGNQVTTIEGNTGDNTDSVERKTHELSSETFYGGVSPW